jgi:hypothetical protein
MPPGTFSIARLIGICMLFPSRALRVVLISLRNFLQQAPARGPDMRILRIYQTIFDQSAQILTID